MPGFIRVDHAFPGVPVVTSLADQILAGDNLLNWSQADALRSEVVDGKIASFVNIAGGSGLLSQALTGARAVLEESAISGYPAARFNGETSVDRYAYSGVFPASSENSFTLIFKPINTGVQYNVCGWFAGTDSRFILNVSSAGVVRVQLDSNSNYEFPSAATDQWNIVTVSHNGGNLLRAVVNGVRQPDKTVSGPTAATEAFTVGALRPSGSQPYVGHISDIWLHDADIVESGGALVLHAYAKEVYGIGA